MAKPMSFEMDCPFDVLCRLFESNTVSTGMTKEVPGGAVIEYCTTQQIERRDLLHAAEPFVHIAVSFGRDLAVGVLGSWLYDKIKSSKIQRLRINRKEIAISKDAIVTVIQESIEIENGK
ncbi:MAG: hypothetical protein ABR991_01235 [Terracidiphilus sp.]|jgi:hypothetical protein